MDIEMFAVECERLKEEANNSVWQFSGKARTQTQYIRDGVCATADRLLRFVREHSTDPADRR